MAATLDRRITPARDDLAADWLRDEVKAEHYAPGVPRTVIHDGAPLYFTPDRSVSMESQLGRGSTFTFRIPLESTPASKA